MKELEKQAAQLLKDNPEINAVYMTEDGQAFFNKDAAKNHTKTRKLKEPQGFFRSGVPTPQETTDAIKALEVAHEKIEASEASLEIIEKILIDEDFQVEITPDSNSVVALVAHAKNQLIDAQKKDEEQGKALIAAAKEIEDLQKQLAEAAKPATKKK